MPWKGPEHPGDFPTLGFLAADWVAAHCIVPDGFDKGNPFELPDEQLTFVAHHYRLRPVATLGQLAPAFHNRRSQLVRPQKWGKGPLTAALVCLEGVGPALFGGWAEGGEAWDCRDYGCGCGWLYEYEPGEPMGMAWPTPLIQITATSDDQTDNIYDALRPMIDDGPLHEVIPKTGEEFIRLPGGGRVDTVTSNARSRLGQRVTFVPQDETGLWTPASGMVKVAETQRRGAAGMGGRVVETTNMWDPAENSVAQRTAESKAPDLYRDYNAPPPHLSYRDRRDRHRIHAFNYQGAPWVDLDAIDAEANELVELDPAQAERFFGNRPVAGQGVAWDPEAWADLVNVDRVVTDREAVALGFDGSRFHDASALVGSCLEDGHLFVLGIWERPPGVAEDDWSVPELEVDSVVRGALERFDVVRMYGDPPYWQDEMAKWAADYESVREWWTNRDKPMAWALRRFTEGIAGRSLTHDGDSRLAEHVANARKKATNIRDEDGRFMWTIRKPTPKSAQKIDAAMAAVLSVEARGDALAAGWRPKVSFIPRRIR